MFSQLHHNCVSGRLAWLIFMPICIQCISGYSKGMHLISQLESDYKDIYGTLGFPIAILPNSRLFLTPFATYAYNKTTAGIHDITEKSSRGK